MQNPPGAWQGYSWRAHLSLWANWAYWIQAEVLAGATDLAEFVGASLGFELLFGVTLLQGAPWRGSMKTLRRRSTAGGTSSRNRDAAPKARGRSLGRLLRMGASPPAQPRPHVPLLSVNACARFTGPARERGCEAPLSAMSNALPETSLADVRRPRS